MQVFQESDGMVYVRTDELTYADTRANFEADSGTKLEPLPASALERVYERGVRHAFNNASGTFAGGDREWEFGDSMIANVGNLVAKQTARLEAAAAVVAAAEAAAAAQAERERVAAQPVVVPVAQITPDGGTNVLAD